MSLSDDTPSARANMATAVLATAPAPDGGGDGTGLRLRSLGRRWGDGTAPAVGSRVPVVRFDAPGSDGQPGGEEPLFHGGGEVLSSLPLQVALYFHAYFSPLWFIAILAISSMDELFGGVFTAALYFAFVLLEPIRLYLGYHGNLREKVPALTGFIIVSGLFEALLAIFLLFVKPAIEDATSAMEWALDLVMLAMLVVETVMAYNAAVRMSREQTSRYHLLFDGVEDDARQPMVRETEF